MNKNNGVKHDMNLVKLVEHFHSEERCRVYLEQLRWPDSVTCPRCQSKSISEIRRAQPIRL